MATSFDLISLLFHFVLHSGVQALSMQLNPIKLSWPSGIYVYYNYESLCSGAAWFLACRHTCINIAASATWCETPQTKRKHGCGALLRRASLFFSFLRSRQTDRWANLKAYEGFTRLWLGCGVVEFGEDGGPACLPAERLLHQGETAVSPVVAADEAWSQTLATSMCAGRGPQLNPDHSESHQRTMLLQLLEHYGHLFECSMSGVARQLQVRDGYKPHIFWQKSEKHRFLFFFLGRKVSWGKQQVKADNIDVPKMTPSPSPASA